jgi:hypothetical protein
VTKILGAGARGSHPLSSLLGLRLGLEYRSMGYKTDVRPVYVDGLTPTP